MTGELDLEGRLARDLDSAFPDLVTVYEDRLFGTAFRLTGSHQDAEDLAQETLVRAYRALGGYPPHRIRSLRLRGWLWTILLNLVRNRARSRKRRPPTADIESAASPPIDSDVAATAVAIVDVARALTTLEPADREVLVLRYVADLSVEEIAEATGQPQGTVKSRTHRSLARLRIILGEETS